MDLCAASALWLGRAAHRSAAIGTSARIGITRDADRLLRFYEDGLQGYTYLEDAR